MLFCLEDVNRFSLCFSVAFVLLTWSTGKQLPGFAPHMHLKACDCKIDSGLQTVGAQFGTQVSRFPEPRHNSEANRPKATLHALISTHNGVPQQHWTTPTCATFMAGGLEH